MNFSRPHFVLQTHNKQLELGKKTRIMGILNVTPDSFSDGNLYFGDVSKAVERVEEMLIEGADIIDIGGESTRPGSAAVSETEEINRVVPVIKQIQQIQRKLGTILISIDTYKAKVALAALDAGADMINCMGGFTFDKHLLDIIKKYRCPAIIYHIRGTPKTMQSKPIVYDDVVSDITTFFSEQIETATKNGIDQTQLILDPGIGFGKMVEHNLEIVRRLDEFHVLGSPILVGISRKSHLGKILQDELGLDTPPPPNERLEASLAETAIAVQNGVHIVRSHDIKETKRFLVVFNRLMTS